MTHPMLPCPLAHVSRAQEIRAKEQESMGEAIRQAFKDKRVKRKKGKKEKRTFPPVRLRSQRFHRWVPPVISKKNNQQHT